MKHAFNKDILRSIKASWGRFIAILVIVALGAGFYAGLRMTAPDMRISADEYYDGTNLYDIRVLGTLGLSDGIETKLAQVEGVDEIMPAYETDILGIANGSQFAIRVHSLNAGAAEASDTSDGVHALSGEPDYLNRPILVSGEWPQAVGECVLSAETIAPTELSIGDTIEVSEGTMDPSEVLETQRYTIVGFVRSPYYSSSASLGITSIGSGAIEQYMFVPAATFKEGYPFSSLYLTVAGAQELDAMSPAYYRHVEETMDRITALTSELETMRLDEIKESAQEELDTEYAEYEGEKAEALAELDAAAADLAQAKQQIDASSAVLGSAITPELLASTPELAATMPELAAALESYEQGLAEYENSKQEAEEQFAEAETEFAEAQQAIDDTEAPRIFVLDRSKNYGAKSFDSDAGRVDQIAHVFPLMFFLVAALISLTTMTRMVEEERRLIGTYKALGYSRQRIASKYVLYAFIASLVGALIGIVLLTQVLPGVIMNAYRIMYDIPTGSTPIDPGIALLSAALGIGVTCFAAWAAAVTTLREKPAALMLPRVPKPGKRIFLERIGFIWSRLSFSWKVTFRNLFRYKRRLAMTLIGIAGCTGLLLTGFGLSNAINDIIPKQFGEIYQYNMSVALTSDISSEEEQLVDAVLADDSKVFGHTRAHTENITVMGVDGENHGAVLTVPEDSARFAEFHLMRDRLSQESLTPDQDTILISEKLATWLQLAVGDRLTLARQDVAGYATADRYEFAVGGIMENYVTHYLVMEPSLYRKVIGEEPAYLTIYANVSTSSTDRDYLSDTLLPLEGVRTVGYNDDAIEGYEKALASVDFIVIVIIVAAAALAFVVLYNLTNINITERQREIATLRVLGFNKREMANYVFREILLLTILGAALGLVLGIFMEAYVVTTAEVDAVMFAREIHASSFIVSFVLTVLFTFVIAFFMRGKLSRIDMVESLKSNE